MKGDGFLIEGFFLLLVGFIEFLIIGGPYLVTALRKLTMRVTVYTKHQLTLQKLKVGFFFLMVR